MQKLTATNIFFLTAGCFLAFFVFGFTDNLKGPTLPAMLAELNIDYGTGGNIFFGEYLGFLIATLITGILADRFGLKLVLLLAGACLVLGVSGYSAFKSAWLLSGSLFILGSGLGALELGPNAMIVNLHHERKALYLNLMAVLHGLGSMLAPLFAGWLFNLSVSWRVIYRWDLILIALFVFIFLFLRFPRLQEKTQLNFREIPRVAFKDKMVWFYLSIALYVAAEIGTASWLVTFLQKERGLSVTASNQALSLFFATIVIGRFLGGFVVHRIGYLRSIFFASLGAFACMAIGLFGPISLSILLPLTGLFLSIIFPTITAATSDSHTENINTILGVLFTFAGIGGVVGPWLVGWSSDLFGLCYGFFINLFLIALMILSILILMKGQQHGTNS
jgi:fucose permease